MCVQAKIEVGSKVVLTPGYKDCDDAAGGPLKPGEQGTVVQDDGSSKPYRVKSADERMWWYTPAALQLAPVGAGLAPIGAGSSSTVRAMYYAHL